MQILQNQHRQSCNTYASEKEIARNNTTKEETSDCLPSLYAITVLAGEFSNFPADQFIFCNTVTAPEDADCNKTIKVSVN